MVLLALVVALVAMMIVVVLLNLSLHSGAKNKHKIGYVCEST